jgi:hypothetical protein
MPAFLRASPSSSPRLGLPSVRRAAALALAIPVALGASGMLSAACSSDGAPPVRGRPDAGVTDGGVGDGGGGAPDLAGPDAERPDLGFATCSADERRAGTVFQPVDIVWVVDSSGSMRNEAERVQANMNAFVGAIERAGIDVHVVMISSSAFVSVPPPLGTDPSRYLLLDRAVGSSEPLRALVAEHPRYAAFLRPLSQLHLVAVTDDESDLRADAFMTMMTGLLGRGFTFHAIASERGPTSFTNPSGACTVPGSGFPPDGAAAPGLQYLDLTARTGGRFFSICTPAAEWASLFDTLVASVAVATRLPCIFDIPAPPDGMTFDRFRVNVVYTPGGGGAPLTFPYADTPSGPDCSRGPGWYYDDAASPSRIFLCPAACDLVERDAAGVVAIAFGCETLLI